MLLGAWHDDDIDRVLAEVGCAGRDAVTGPGRIFAGYALDLDGTVYLGDALLPHAAETIQGIRDAGSRLVFLTNNPLHSRPATRSG